MDTEVYASALKDALNEIHNLCPDITSTFLFRKDGEIIAGDEITPEKTMAHVVDSFDSILEKADAIGGVKSITLEGSNGRVYVSCIDDLYFVTVTSVRADINHVNIITHVLIPTILKLFEKICPTPLKGSSFLTKKLESPAVEPAEETKIEEPEKTAEEAETEPSLLECPVNQLIVEHLSGFRIPSDTVRVDGEMLSRWEELNDGSRIKEVEIETFGGRTIRCIVKPIKDVRYDKKGVIQMPEKIQLNLEIKKGELVRVKPIVE